MAPKKTDETIKQSIEHFKQVLERAEQGDAEAQYQAGHFYTAAPNGVGEAIRWYKKAGEQGHGIALMCIGELFEEGTLVFQDYAEAAKWYREGAERGSVVAQWRLGRLYQEGKGVSKNEIEAYAWFSVAMEMGSIMGKRLRKDIVLNQEDLAKACKLSAKYCSQYVHPKNLK